MAASADANFVAAAVGAGEQGPMSKIVREHFPADRLPAELREGLAPDARVTVTIEAEVPPAKVMTLEEMFALRREVFSSPEEAVRHVRALRDEWGE